jgi:phospholipid N-methyltransferase
MKMLRPGGVLQPFTYIGRPPIGARILDELDFEAKLVGVVPLNLPPAFVYRSRSRTGETSE